MKALRIVHSDSYTRPGIQNVDGTGHLSEIVQRTGMERSGLKLPLERLERSGLVYSSYCIDWRSKIISPSNDSKKVKNVKSGYVFKRIRCISIFCERLTQISTILFFTAYMTSPAVLFVLVLLSRFSLCLSTVRLLRKSLSAICWFEKPLQI